MSIKQKPAIPPPQLPHFRNLGVILRILLWTNLGGILAAACVAITWKDFIEHWIDLASVLEPSLIMNLLLLIILETWLVRLPKWLAVMMVLGITATGSVLVFWCSQLLYAPLALNRLPQIERVIFFTSIATAFLLYYFDLFQRALSPALTEARLHALQARIRPHFLFNSLNAVLSLIRKDPQRAESVLEDLAELFRMMMADQRTLVPLAREVAWCRQYLNIEEVRLGERLQIEWHVEKMPGDALVPPLVLQPLLENAIYHGIEPCSTPGFLDINIYLAKGQVHLVLRNPYQHSGDHHGGNKMALGNIRERLLLHFDVEAQLHTKVTERTYTVHISLPYTRSAP